MKDSTKDKLAFLESIISLLPGHVYWKDKNGVYLGSNDQQAQTTGFASGKELIGKTDFELPWKNEAKHISDLDQKVMKTKKPHEFVETVTLPNKQKATFLSKKVPLTDENNTVIGVLGISFDITKQQKDLAELLAKEKADAEKLRKTISNYLNNITANLPCHVYWKDENGVYLGCNDIQAKSVGLQSGHQVVGKTDFDIFKREYAIIFRENDREVMKSGKPKTTEEPVNLSDGTHILALSTKAPLKDDEGNIIGILGISIDITERKQMEEDLKTAKEKAEIANKAKSEFLAVASHELRIPLTGIIGMAKFLSDANLPLNERDEYTQHLQSSTTHLLSLINDLLDFAKLEAHKFELIPAPLNLKQLIEETGVMLTASAKTKGLDMLVEYAPGVPYQILGDSRALRQILINFVGNAIKFTSKGHVRIRVTCNKQNTEEAELALAVEDTGPGIPADKINIIFDRFQQIESPYERTTSQAGTGLGLSITKKLVELMNGNIVVKSKVGKGSTFTCTITFPLQTAATAHSAWDDYKNSVRVLIIDDSVRGNVICKQLGSSLAEVVTGKESNNTLTAAQNSNQPYHIVFVDHHLTTADPLDIVGHLQKRKIDPKPIVLLLTDRHTVADKKLIKAAGFFDSITKPVTPIELQTFITTAWEQWKETHNTAPLNNTVNKTANNKKTKTTKPKTSKQKCRVLIVEDDIIIQTIHKRYAEQLNGIVTIAENGTKAVELAKQDFDLVLMDVGLPEINGFDATKLIRKNENGTKKHLRIIGLTGFGDNEAKERCLNAGMDDVMVKPIEIDELKKLMTE